MKTISLIGKANCGKSNTINKLIDEFIKRNIKPYKGIKNCFCGRGKFDRTTIFQFQEKLLLITTIGDTVPDLQKEINNAVKVYQINEKDIHMFVCASHSGKIKNYLVNTSTSTIFIPKLFSCEIDALNNISDEIFMNILYDTIINNY